VVALQIYLHKQSEKPELRFPLPTNSIGREMMNVIVAECEPMLRADI
jgi:hypothetical protein